MITYKNISVLDYESKSPFIIPHIVNHSNQLGAGVALAISKKYPRVKSYYHNWANNSMENLINDMSETGRFTLGEIQFLKVEDNIYVANMLAQATPRGDTINGVYLPPIRYDCLKECMLRVAEVAKDLQLEIVMPLFSCGLAGGNFTHLILLVQELWKGFNVTICIPDVKEYNKCLNIS